MVVIFQLLFTYLPLSHTIFAVAALSLTDWLIIALATSPILLVVELEKVIARRYNKITKGVSAHARF